MFVTAVVSSIVSLLEMLKSLTTNPKMTPFLSSGNGSCQLREMLVTPVSTTVTICGAPDGTVVYK